MERPRRPVFAPTTDSRGRLSLQEMCASPCKKRAAPMPPSGREGDRLRWWETAKRNSYALPSSLTPSVTYGDSSLTEGAFLLLQPAGKPHPCLPQWGKGHARIDSYALPSSLTPSVTYGDSSLTEGAFLLPQPAEKPQKPHLLLRDPSSGLVALLGMTESARGHALKAHPCQSRSNAPHLCLPPGGRGSSPIKSESPHRKKGACAYGISAAPLP